MLQKEKNATNISNEFVILPSLSRLVVSFIFINYGTKSTIRFYPQKEPVQSNCFFYPNKNQFVFANTRKV